MNKNVRGLGARSAADEGGFGIAEVLVAMFLLAVIAVAIIPILVQGLRLSVQNATVATATQLANQQIEQVRGPRPARPSSPAPSPRHRTTFR
ncbi:type IV pilus modification PilV family protein [Leifsonia sp. L25]|uniref:type IV pilus modification PilV family protein n=1 Tax=Leifsonia sp. L25 TaxID=3423957 RepID=UPI003D69AC48